LGYHLGIDLGTTYTAAATARDDRVQVVPLGNRAAQIPSVIFLREDDTILVGEAAERRGQSDPGRVAREFKRRVGDPTPILVGATPYSAEALMAKLLGWVVSKVTELEGGPPERVAVTHPANWGTYKKDLLHQAVRLADLENVTFLSEPEAAALHYASNERVELGSIVAVYDLGGGTFDATVLAKTEAGFDVLGHPEGIERLGGIDFDEAVYAHVNAATGRALDGLDPADQQAVSAVARLRQETIAAKEALSADTDTTVPVLLPNLQTDVRLTRPEFEAMIRLRLADTIEAMRRAIRSAGITADQLTKVLLVGGSSRIPLVSQLVSTELGRPVALDAHPKHAIPLGAALAAAATAEPPNVAAREQPPTEILPARPAPPTAPEPPQPPAPAGPERPIPPPPPPGDATESLIQKAPAPHAHIAHAAGDHVATPPLTRQEIGPALLAPVEDAPPRGGASRVAGLIVAGVLIVAAGVGAYLMFGGSETSDSSPPLTADAGGTAESSTTSSAAPAKPTVHITSVQKSRDTYTIDFSTSGFSPTLDGDSESHHIHFFFNTTKPANAGANGDPPGTWDLYGGESPYVGSAQKIGGPSGDKGATAVCAVVATPKHEVSDPNSGNCVPIP